jgi:hypothetical protein
MPFRGQKESFCYALPVFDRITDSADAPGPERSPRVREARIVNAHYRLEDIATWARHSDVQETFPEVPALLQDAVDGLDTEITLVRLEDGWHDLRLVDIFSLILEDPR